jgi:hypothetical protein
MKDKRFEELKEHWDRMSESQREVFLRAARIVSDGTALQRDEPLLEEVELSEVQEILKHPRDRVYEPVRMSQDPDPEPPPEDAG